MKYSTGGLIASVLFFVISLSAKAQTTDAELSATILHLDSLFWNSYNNCDSGSMRRYFTEDLQFYHDKGGATFSYQTMVNGFQKNLCNGNFKVRREAVPGTVVVYPMRSQDTLYAALITGEHYFYITENGKPEKREGLAKFTQLWLKKDGTWKMSLVLSFDHGPAPVANRRSIQLPIATLRKYTGTYKGPQTDNMVIKEENGSLAMVLPGKTVALFAASQHSFYMQDRDISFVFSGNKLQVIENGKVAEELALVKK